MPRPRPPGFARREPARLFLRAPPFPDAHPVAQARHAGPDGGSPLPLPTIHALADAIAAHRVGGAYWRPLAPPPGCRTLICGSSWNEVRALARHWQAQGDTVAVALRRPDRRQEVEGVAIVPDCDPWSLVDQAERVIAHPADEIALVAGAAGKPLVDASSGQPVDRADWLALLARRIGDGAYHDPFSGRAIRAEEWIEILGEWRRTIDANRAIGSVGGIGAWKRSAVAAMLWAGAPVPIARRSPRAPRGTGGITATWPTRLPPGEEDRLRAARIPLAWIEDGFIRSEGLGTHLRPPQSIVVDHAGIHYDPRQPSDLERLLAETPFSEALCARARRLIRMLVAGGVTKYAAAPRVNLALPAAARRVLVVGQVSDDRSVLLGGCDIRDNLELLRRVRAAEPHAHIVFRPHPDVVSGLRKGHVDPRDARRLADSILADAPLASLLEQVDAVHVLTSLAGFEALLRGRDVVTHGQPFYAGWGLTVDRAPPIARRGRPLTLDQLVAAALILYPRYRDPVTGLPCPPEVLVERLAAHRPSRASLIQRLRMAQGRVLSSGRALLAEARA